MNKPLGSIINAKFFTSKPLVFNFVNLTFNKLTLMTGMNGAGKSFIHACIYMMNFITSTKILSLLHSSPMDDVKTAQFALDSCISSEVTGTMGLCYSSSCTIDLAIEEGKVTNVTFNCIEDITEPTHMTYMSSSFRTFNALCSYLVSRKSCGKTVDGERIEEMAKNYKLYDVLYIEALINKMPITISQALAAHLEKFEFREKLKTIDVDLNKCEFFAIQEDGSTLVIHRWFGSGHQSLLNMLLAQNI